MDQSPAAIPAVEVHVAVDVPLARSGRAYLDCWSGHGALIHPAILRAILEQAQDLRLL